MHRHATRKRILLVDDSSTVLLTAKLMLSAYEVITARNGEECLTKAVDERPDLILLDVMMPKLNGFEACRRLREREETRDVPILMMTTRGEPHSVQAGYESGCSEYITKPFDGAELLAKVRAFVGD
jgi:DNA-binding response OmpR family regulator